MVWIWNLIFSGIFFFCAYSANVSSHELDKEQRIQMWVILCVYMHFAVYSYIWGILHIYGLERNKSTLQHRWTQVLQAWKKCLLKAKQMKKINLVLLSNTP